MGFDECVEATVESLSKGFQLASLGYNKRGATHLDSGNFACKQHTHQLCKVCDHRWLKSPPVIGNPLAAFGCFLGANDGRGSAVGARQYGVHILHL